MEACTTCECARGISRSFQSSRYARRTSFLDDHPGAFSSHSRRNRGAHRLPAQAARRSSSAQAARTPPRASGSSTTPRSSRRSEVLFRSERLEQPRWRRSRRRWRLSRTRTRPTLEISYPLEIPCGTRIGRLPTTRTRTARFALRFASSPVRPCAFGLVSCRSSRLSVDTYLTPNAHDWDEAHAIPIKEYKRVADAGAQRSPVSFARPADVSQVFSPQLLQEEQDGSPSMLKGFQFPEGSIPPSGTPSTVRLFLHSRICTI